MYDISAQDLALFRKVPRLSVVVPAYNEERRIVPALHAVSGYLTSCGVEFEIIVVDDGSTDGTASVVDELSTSLPHVRLMRLSVNSGKGAAVKAGMLTATGSHILFTDADQSTPIDQLPRLLRPMLGAGGFAIAIGSRGLSESHVIVGQKAYRQVLARGFGLLTRSLLVRGFCDCQCGFKLFTTGSSRALFSQMTTSTAIFDMELMLLAARSRYRIAEVPVEWTHDADSRLVYNFSKALGLVSELLRMRLHWRVFVPPRADVMACRADDSTETSDLPAMQVAGLAAPAAGVSRDDA